MKIKVKVSPWAKNKNIRIEKDLFSNEEIYFVKLTARPVAGAANKALIQDLAEYFNVRKGQVRIVSGETSRVKIVEVDS